MRARTLSNSTAKREILERVSLLTPGHAALWGRMVEEMLSHLVGAFRMASKELNVESHFNPVTGTIIRYVALHTPVHWIRGYPTVPELDQKKYPRLRDDLEHLKADLRGRIERFSSSSGQDILPEHPLWGRLSLEEWMRWGYRHTDHHLRQFGC